MKYSLVVFDMDGTLADTSPGILQSFHYAAREMGVPEPDDALLMAHMGGSLHLSVQDALCIPEEDVQKAVDLFRTYYDTKGRMESEMFPGTLEVLEKLHSEGVKLGVATMKLHEYAVEQIGIWGVEDLFDTVHGSDVFGRVTKADTIDMCMYDCGIGPADTLMVGDTPNDYHGAKASGTDFLAVTYGFGFTELSCKREGLSYATRPLEILNFVERHEFDL